MKLHYLTTGPSTIQADTHNIVLTLALVEKEHLGFLSCPSMDDNKVLGIVREQSRYVGLHFNVGIPRGSFLGRYRFIDEL